MNKLKLICTVYITLLTQTSACLESTILITGGAGYIGSATVLYMIQKGYNIIVIDKKFPESNYFAQAKKIDRSPHLPQLHFDPTNNLTDKVIFIRSDFA